MGDNHNISDLYNKITNELSKVIVGKGEIEAALVLCLLADGNMLIEGLPGTAKTKIAKTFATVTGCDFKRIQFTPDMMPADITGFYVYSPAGNAKFVQGPIFANIVLADELNRTTPRTQSALLEAMQEHQVTIEGKSFPLGSPFMVIATQVPAGGEGTYPLTDVQVDRFLLKVKSEYPSRDEEKQIIANIDKIDESAVQAVTSQDEIIRLQQLAHSVHVSPDIVEYTIALITSLRSDPDILWGPSVRSGIALYKCARVQALLDGRDFVIPDDIKSLAPKAIEHRIRVKPESEMDDITPRIIVNRALEKIPVPKINV